MNVRSRLFLFVFALLLSISPPLQAQFATFASRSGSGRGIVFVDEMGNRLRLTPYGNSIIRVQAVMKGEEFFPDDYYEMVQSHDWPGTFAVNEASDHFLLSAGSTGDIAVRIEKNPLRLIFQSKGKTILSEAGGIQWSGDTIAESFAGGEAEHFTGLGHGFFGRSSGLDLKGQVIGRNYGTEHGDQSPLIVPFYMSSRGYGVFLNSTFTNRFSFKSGGYGFAIDTHGAKGRMDFFVLIAPQFAKILDLYTQLTGRPRFPPLAMFGLGLSDKSNDETSTDPSDENWWKRKVSEQRTAGMAIDHLINDNRWRAGGGKRCESFFDWDKGRFPDPAEYASWLKANGLVTTIDYNRCISVGSEGWSPSYNIPFSEKVDHAESVPDFTRPEVRSWFWNLFYEKSLDPQLHYPGDALWIDEFDELGPIADSVHLGNGRIWGEMKNYYPFLIAKALVQEGWDRSLAPAKRPFVWVRGMTAGAQRYATLWTGDIKPTNEDMRNQIVAMQLAGMSGFPYEGHDAGGFYNWDTKKGPDENLYRRWAMAMGCFTPFWKPHGWGQSRWPLDRSAASLESAKKFTGLRYELLPYTYTLAALASSSGMPMARPMILEYQSNPESWKHDTQYMWGSDLLVAPNPAGSDSLDVWLPPGNWVDCWSNTVIAGDRTVRFASPSGGLMLFAKAGAVIPRAYPALGTAFIDKTRMKVSIYAGNDGAFTLYEDDGLSEKYKTGEKRKTHFAFHDAAKEFEIGAAEGDYKGANDYRSYACEFIGVAAPSSVLLNGAKLNAVGVSDTAEGFYFNAARKVLVVNIAAFPVQRPCKVKFSP